MARARRQVSGTRATPPPKKGKDSVSQRDIDRLQKAGNTLEEAAEELEVAASSIASAYYLAEVNNDPDLAIEGTERQVAKGIVAQRDSGVRWERLMARAGLSKARVKAIYEEETGIPANETWTGRGAPPPGMTIDDAREIAAIPLKSSADDNGASAPKRSVAKRGGKTAPAKRTAKTAAAKRSVAKRSVAKREAAQPKRARTRAERLAKSGKADPS